MTPKQKEAILEVCRNLLSSGLAFGYQKHLTEPEYSDKRALAEIVKIVERVEAENVAE